MPGKLLVLVKGEATVLKSGKKIATLSPGDLIGEMSFMSNKPASADVVTVGEAKVAYWSHKDLDRIHKKNNILYNKFISVIGHDLVKKLNKKNHEFVNNSTSH